MHSIPFTHFVSLVRCILCPLHPTCLSIVLCRSGLLASVTFDDESDIAKSRIFPKRRFHQMQIQIPRVFLVYFDILLRAICALIHFSDISCTHLSAMGFIGAPESPPNTLLSTGFLDSTSIAIARMVFIAVMASAFASMAAFTVVR